MFELTAGGGAEVGWVGLDAGPTTRSLFRQGLADAAKIVFFVDLSVSWKSSHSTMVDNLEEKTQQPGAGCVAVVGGGGDLVAALEALGKTQAIISMHPLEEVVLVRLWSCWSWLDCGLLRVRTTTVSTRPRRCES